MRASLVTVMPATPRRADNAAPLSGRLARDERGAVAIVFALTLTLAIMLAGGAVDYGRASMARNRLQNAVDAAALAAGRAWQLSSDLEAVRETAHVVYGNSKPTGTTGDILNMSANAEKKTLHIEASAHVALPFLSIAGLTTYPIDASADVALPEGGNTDTNLEVVMMLDVTGSMAGSKIEALKVAAKDLIDIVVWDDQSRYASRVALVPFADVVNVGSSALANALRGSAKTGSCSSPSAPCTSVTTLSPSSVQWIWGTPGSWFRFPRPDGGHNTWQLSSYCVSERTGPEWASDHSPDAESDRLGPSYGSTSASSCGYMTIDPADLEMNSVQPLTSDKTLLKRRVDKLTVGGSTAGQVGTAWAWYMLSPKWASFWSPANRPAAYNTEKVKKIAVLMTDGEYNTGHCNGIVASDSGDGSGGDTTKINCKATNGLSDHQARQICSSMKTGTGITVYTVGFDLGGNQTAIETLRGCASDASKFYEASSGDALRNAFRDIALQLSKLRLID